FLRPDERGAPNLTAAGVCSLRCRSIRAGTPVTTTKGGRPSTTTTGSLISDVLRKLEFRAVEDTPREDEQRHRHDAGDAERRRGPGALKEHVSVGVDDMSHWVQRQHGRKPCAHARNRVKGRRAARPER